MPRAEDQHALLTQRRKGAARSDMEGRVQPPLDGHLNQRNVRIRKSHFEGDEHAVIQAPLRVDSRGDTRVLEQGRGTSGERGCARHVVAQLIGMGREVVIVVDQFGPFGAGEGEAVRLPMSRDDEDGLGLLGERDRQVAQERFHTGPHAARIVHEEAGAAAMRDEVGGLDAHGHTLRCRRHGGGLDHRSDGQNMCPLSPNDNLPRRRISFNHG